jgi:hypothetical protein
MGEIIWRERLDADDDFCRRSAIWVKADYMHSEVAYPEVNDFLVAAPKVGLELPRTVFEAARLMTLDEVIKPVSGGYCTKPPKCK